MRQMIPIKVKKLSSEAKIPAYAKDGDAGMDLFALEEVTIVPNERARIRTGVAMEIPYGYVGLCWDKSGLSMTHGIKVLGGVIDSGFRGELILGVHNLSHRNYTFYKHYKVMQMLIQSIIQAEIVEAEELSESERGEGGFGSTGA